MIFPVVTKKKAISGINRNLMIGVLQILFKQEATWALDDDEIGEVGRARKRKMKRFIQKESFGMPLLTEAP